ncbi:MAG: heavy-metal-associated domain-containing protein, partial [Clostridia bacterium]|nr:heavy-metal-associated domain-containing protein [Clostridia bacterium]
STADDGQTVNSDTVTDNSDKQTVNVRQYNTTDGKRNMDVNSPQTQTKNTDKKLSTECQTITNKPTADNQKNNITKSTINNNVTEDNKMKYLLKIDGMMCMRCVSHVTNALLSLQGVDNAVVSLQDGTAEVTADNTVTAQQLKDVVEAQDYAVTEVKAI